MKKNKKIILVTVSLVLVAAIGAGIFFMGSGSKETVGVYPFNMVGMDGYWGDSQESYGPVTTDKIQTVYLSDTQTVTEVMVAQGDEVKKGDVIMSFDTSLSDLQLERKRLEVEKLKLELDAAKSELQRIKGLKPMEPMPEISIPETPTFLGATLTESYKTYIIAGHEGKSMDTAFVCWLREDTDISDDLLEALRQLVWGDNGLCIHGLKLAECPVCNCTHGPGCEVCTLDRCEPHGLIKELCPDCKTCVHGEMISQCEKCNTLCEDHGIPNAYCVYCNPICVHDKRLKDCTLCSGTLCKAHGVPLAFCKYCCEHNEVRADCDICTPTVPSAPDPGTQAEAQGIGYDGSGYRVQLLADTVPTAPNNYFVIFKVTSGNTELGPQTTWQGAHVQGMGKGFTIRYFTPFTEDYTVPVIEQQPIEVPDYDPGSGMTATQIAELRSAQELKIKELTLKHKMANADYKIMAKEMGDGHIYAEFDGKVVSLLTEEEAKNQTQPIVKVSGGGGFFITGSVSELEKDNLKPGQEVTVNDWSNGGVYTGTVRDIGDFPSLDGYWNGAGNPNTSYYPFTVFVGEEASLQAGSYANIQYSTSGSSGGIYMDRAFVRTEDGQSYVFVLGANGRLEKRSVTVGKSLWGSYLEITSGLSVEDYIAFPYGKDVKEGAPAEEKDISELYSY